MLYRRKFLGGLLQIFGGKLSGIDFQKFLMLATSMQDKPLFEFTPYKYGCFSFTSYCDKRAFTRDGILENDDAWIGIDNVDYFAQLTATDQSILHKVKREYGNLSGNDLVSIVYQKFPYYTINSEIVSNFIDEDSIKRNKEKYYSQTNSAVFSIGYEGKSLEAFINLLIKNNIKVLVDVRKNALSMKYGFSSKQLSNYLKNFNISYDHIPQLGIVADKRKSLRDHSDYEKLFDDYEKTILLTADKYLWQIYSILQREKRICLMCFEADPNMCHRTRILERLVERRSIESYADLA